MKKVGIMQPYLFPYIGYWQLLYAVNEYVVLDDVNYIMRGYINRNSILINGRANRFTIPVLQASQNKLINETKLNFSDKEKTKFLETIRFAYKKAAYFEPGYELIQDIILNDEDDLTEYIIYSMERIKAYLDIRTPIIRSSDIVKDPALRGQDRIIDICKALEADIYINPSGGRPLYSHEKFEQEHMELYFLDPKMEEIHYHQFKNEFVGSLSIIDLIMFNNVQEIRKFLAMYELNEN